MNQFPVEDFISHIVSRYGVNKYPLYTMWKSMLHRCNNPKDKQYFSYGGRGIAVCKEWLDPICFFTWAEKNGFSKDLSIERIDNDKGYSPDNCVYADRVHQNNNRRKYKNNTSGYTGVNPTYFNTFQAEVKSKGKKICIGNFPTAKEASEARNTYIEENNLLNKKGVY